MGDAPLVEHHYDSVASPPTRKAERSASPPISSHFNFGQIPRSSINSDFGSHPAHISSHSNNVRFSNGTSSSLHTTFKSAPPFTTKVCILPLLEPKDTISCEMCRLS